MSKFQTLLNDLRVPVAPEHHHHTRHGWVQFDCPFCSPGTQRWRMGYSIERGSINCWFCGRHRLWETLKALGVPYAKIKDTARGLRGEWVPEEEHEGTYTEPGLLGPLQAAHRDYLRGRGFDPDELERLWELQGTALHPRLPFRIFAPILSRGRRVSWTSRSLQDTGQRWLSAKAHEEAIPAGKLIYGIDYCRNVIFIVEGPSDVWRIGPGAGGVLGVATTNAQIARLVRFPVRVVVYDTSADAQRRAANMAALLGNYPGETYNVELDAADPGSASPAEIRKLRESFL